MMRDALATVAESIVAVECDGAAGSGAFINLGQSRTLVLTCEHVLLTEKPVVIYRTAVRGFRFYETKAEIIARDKKNDLALLGIEKSGLPALEISKTEPQLQEEVCIAGNSNLLFGLSVEGRLQGMRGSHRRRAARYLISATSIVARGISGGPVTNSDTEIVGVMVAGPSDEEVPLHGLGYAVPLPTIRRFLKMVQDAHKEGT